MSFTFPGELFQVQLHIAGTDTNHLTWPSIDTAGEQCVLGSTVPGFPGYHIASKYKLLKTTKPPQHFTSTTHFVGLAKLKHLTEAHMSRGGPSFKLWWGGSGQCDV